MKTRPERVQIAGHYAGPVTRLGAVLIDFGIILGVFAAVGAVTRWLISVFWKVEITPDRSEIGWWALALAMWGFLYLWVGLGVAGRTPGKGLAGLRVVDKRGEPLTSGRAALRVLVYPLSFAVLGVGLLGAIVGRNRRCLHDVIAGTCVIYDWGGRTAELNTPLSRWLSQHENAAPMLAAPQQSGEGGI
jgi:uncharacterized RDD family membrane protein YckC